MSKLRISDSLSLPIDAVTQKFGILGRTGSGKSYAATKFAEEMLESKAQIVVLDPVGVWYGLRIKPDGSEAFKIPILGGLHGDIPIEAGAGALIADLIVDREISAVVDVSGFLLTEQRRFATDFAMQLFHRKKSQRSALHLFVEEAQEFVPQHVRGDVAKMVGAYERLLKLGRNFGIGATLISQRPQSVNKDVLNQTECVLAFQMTGPQERKAVAGWISEKGLDAHIVDELPKLKIGECYIWSPQWLEISKKIRIAGKITADVSSTPKPGMKRIEPKQLSQIDLENLSDKMLATIERAKAEDPKELRKQIAELKRTLDSAREAGANTAAIAMRKQKIIEKPVLRQGEITKLIALGERLEKHMARSVECLRDIPTSIKTEFDLFLIDYQRTHAPTGQLIAKFTDALKKISGVSAGSAVAQFERPRLIDAKPARAPAAREIQVSKTAAHSQNNGDISLGLGERRCGIAIAQHGSVTREQLTVLTGYKRSSRNTYLQRMKSAGLIEDRGDRVYALPALADWLGNDYEPLPTGSELQNYWLQKLPEGERRIFEIVLRSLDGIERDAIDELTGYKRSSRNTYLQRLSSRELIETSGEIVRPSANVL